MIDNNNNDNKLAESKIEAVSMREFNKCNCFKSSKCYGITYFMVFQSETYHIVYTTIKIISKKRREKNVYEFGLISYACMRVRVL